MKSLVLIQVGHIYTKWINIYDAIEHNKSIIKNQPDCIGLFIDRELYMLEVVAKEIIEKSSSTQN